MIDEIINNPPLPKEGIGKCALCGKECKLTFEHIPPRAANNSTPAKPVSGAEYFKKNNRFPWDTSGIKYENQQKGMGLFSLCQECNNNTGAFYGNDYLEFAKRAVAMIMSDIPDSHDIVDFKEIYPLRIIKQICSMFCSINRDLPYLDEMRKFVLDKESNNFDKKKYRIQMYFNKGNIIKYNGYSCLIFLGSSMIEMSEIVAPPFGFQLIIDPKDNEHYNGFNITNFVDCKYNTIATVTMPIVFYEVNNIFPDDYRSKEEIIAQIEKSEAFKKENNNGTV